MKMTVLQKQEFVKSALYHELRCLLGAATVWHIFKERDAGFDVVVAMDSAFLHSRCLFNFFTETEQRYDISIVEFGPSTPYCSSIYSIWKESLHRHVLHLSTGRATPSNLKDGVHLNAQVGVFAAEVLSLWKQFESDPAANSYASALTCARKRAIEDAANDAAGRGVPRFT